MNPNRKALFTFLSFVLAMLVIACSCSSLIPTGLIGSTESMPGLAGKWENPDTNDVFEIAWQNNQYVVLSASWNETSYPIDSQSWTGSSLMWSYYDSDLSVTVSLETTSVSGDTLYVNWSLSDGTSGTAALNRVQ